MKLKPFSIAGIVLALGGFALYAAGGVVFMDALDNKEQTAAQRQLVDKQCRKQLAILGEVKQSGTHLNVMVSNVTDPRQALGDATAAAGMCPNRVMTGLCIGSGCDGSKSNSNVTMTIRLTEAFIQ